MVKEGTVDSEWLEVQTFQEFAEAAQEAQIEGSLPLAYLNALSDTEDNISTYLQEALDKVSTLKTELAQQRVQALVIILQADQELQAAVFDFIRQQAIRHRIKINSEPRPLSEVVRFIEKKYPELQELIKGKGLNLLVQALSTFNSEAAALNEQVESRIFQEVD